MQRAGAIVTRGYATATASKMVKTPIPLFGVEGRYTTALFSAASKQQQLDAVETDLKKLSKVIESDTKFRDFLYNPLANLAHKKDILQQTLRSKLGVCDLTINLVNVMTESRRLKYLNPVAKSYIRMMELTRGEKQCMVTTAKPFTEDALRKELEASLKGFTKNKLNIQMKVDPTILGGMIIDFSGEHYIDMSIRSKIKMYSDLLQQGI